MSPEFAKLPGSRSAAALSNSEGTVTGANVSKHVSKGVGTGTVMETFDDLPSRPSRMRQSRLSLRRLPGAGIGALPLARELFFNADRA